MNDKPFSLSRRGLGIALAALLAATAGCASRPEATRTQMERQHYAYDASRPELLVNLRLVVREKQEIRSHSYGRTTWRAWPAATDIQTLDYRQGTLAIDLIDPERRLLVWHGVAEGRLDAKAMEQPGAAIEAAVGEIFARFPGAQP